MALAGGWVSLDGQDMLSLEGKDKKGQLSLGRQEWKSGLSLAGRVGEMRRVVTGRPGQGGRPGGLSLDGQATGQISL